MKKDYPTPCVRLENGKWVISFSVSTTTSFGYATQEEAIDYASHHRVIQEYGKLYIQEKENPKRFTLYKEWTDEVCKRVDEEE